MVISHRSPPLCVPNGNIVLSVVTVCAGGSGKGMCPRPSQMGVAIFSVHVGSHFAPSMSMLAWRFSSTPFPPSANNGSVV